MLPRKLHINMDLTVDHTPALMSYTVSRALGNEVAKYIDDIIEGKEDTNEVLKKATIIQEGKIIDQRIIDFQNR